MEDTPPASFPPTIPSTDSSEYIVYHGNDALVILSISDAGVSLKSDLSCTESTLLIYSEAVYLEENLIQASGLNLGIFCNRLVTVQNTYIDVSGRKGNARNAQHINGEDGTGGGSIWLYIEDASEDLPLTLSLKVNGWRWRLRFQSIRRKRFWRKWG